MSNDTFHANGKLLITGEYFVLDGALALALPVRFGQSLSVSFNDIDDDVYWKSFDHEHNCWFEAVFQKDDFELKYCSNEAFGSRLHSVFQNIKKQDSNFFPQQVSLSTNLNFPRKWGLGTSSTLIYLLAQWSKVDPFQLQFDTFGGSGYDIACAGANGAILYKKVQDKPEVESCQFFPAFSDQLYFVFLGKKQDSRQGILRYEEKREKGQGKSIKDEISKLTLEFLKESDLKGFEKLIIEHEEIVSKVVGLPMAKTLYFNDYWGEVKSLGAWGGDFVMVTSDRPMEETQSYFNEKGFDVFIPYRNMVL